MIKVIWPEYISLRDWSAALIADYPEENLPLLDNEDKWQDWAAVVCGSGIFERANIPSPFVIEEGRKKSNFAEWQDWAKIVYTNLANELDIPKSIVG